MSNKNWKMGQIIVAFSEYLYLSQNFFPHSGHTWSLIFWWKPLMCRFKLNRVGKVLAQSSQIWLPSSIGPNRCFSSWFFKNFAFLKSFLQTWHSSFSLMVGCSFLLCITSEYSRKSTFPQCSQKKKGFDSGVPGRWVWTCSSSSFTVKK